MSEDDHRLGELSRRLLGLHAALLEAERRVHEQTHGATTRAQLLRLVLDHEDFAWLRALSGLLARIDEALDAEGPAGDAETFFRETRQLLRSGAGTRFGTKYREALQRSPEVVMAHADVIRLLPPPHSATRDAS